MGKVSRKKPDGSHGSSSKNTKGMGPIASTSSTSALSLSSPSSGRISKSSKKSVTFRSNLTDVASSSGMMAPSSSSSSSSTSNVGVMSLANSMDLSSSGAMNLSHLGKSIKKDVKGKKSRMKVKREAFQKKIDLIKKVEIEEKEAQKRKQTPIVGDTKALMDALPQTTNTQQQQQGPSTSNGIFNPLMDLAGFVATHNLEEFKTLPKRKFNTKQRQKEIAEGLEYFAASLNYQPPQLL